MLMGSNKIWHLIWVMFYVLSLQYVQGQFNQSRESLDSFLHDHALKAMRKSRSGILYKISLPANFSGMEVSIVRIRSSSLWLRGANYSFVDMPPRILPSPFSRRLHIVYQNLGNWSSDFYNVPNYTFVAPVLGFLAYDANTSRDNLGMVELNTMKDQILVNFAQISLPGDANSTALKCVRFSSNGEIEFSNVTETNSCVARGQGHFSIVIPSLPNGPTPSPAPNERKQRYLKWWEIGFAVGIVGLVLLVGFGFLLYKLIRRKRIGRMEQQSERSETLDSIWVGTSRMPSATGIRTQPVLENSFVP